MSTFGLESFVYLCFEFLVFKLYVTAALLRRCCAILSLTLPAFWLPGLVRGVLKYMRVYSCFPGGYGAILASYRSYPCWGSPRLNLGYETFRAPLLASLQSCLNTLILKYQMRIVGVKVFAVPTSTAHLYSSRSARIQRNITGQHLARRSVPPRVEEISSLALSWETNKSLRGCGEEHLTGASPF